VAADYAQRSVGFAHRAAAALASSRSGCRYRSAHWPGLAGSLLESALLRGLRNPFLLSLGCGLAILSLLRVGPLRRLRFGVVAAVVIALGNLLQLFRGLTLCVFGSGRAVWGKVLPVDFSIWLIAA
jgi:hypothetical protein